MVQPEDIVVYERVNEALAEMLFGSDKAGKPAYVLPEAEVLTTVLTRVGAPADDPRRELARIVRSTLYLDPEDEGTGPLRWHVIRSRQHSRRRQEIPPSLSLLAVLSMAADVMHASEGMSAANYYGRLMDLLDVPTTRQTRVQQHYMARAEELWLSLNRWLEVWEGERGVPTAYAVSTRYVGLPMSQALVRQRDRQVLPEIFWEEGLPPGFRMAASDMEQILNLWVSRAPSPLSQPLRTLWTNAPARERIVQVACLELESWSGQHREGDGPSPAGMRRSGALRLLAFLRTFPKRMLELNLSVPRVGEEGEVPVLCMQGGDGTVELPLAPGPMSTLRLSSTTGVDFGSLVGDKLVGTLAGAIAPVERMPRRVVPLRWDELQGCHVEVERVELGDDTLLLVVHEIRAKVDTLLGSVARPGFHYLADIPGLPAGWFLYRDVQVLDSFEGQVHMDLLPLLPRARTSLVLSGGFALPGRLRKWSSLDPPEVRATAAGAETIRIQVDRGTTLGDRVWSATLEGGVAIAPLSPLELADGEYLVTMNVDGARKPAATSLLRLRSADSPVLDRTGRASGLVYVPGSGPLWPFSAQGPDERPFIDGGRANRLDELEASARPGVAMPDFRPRPRPQAQSVGTATRVGQRLGDQSCMRTGRHRIQLPPAGPGRARGSSIQGECTTCGLVKRYPVRGKVKQSAVTTSHLLDRLVVPPVQKRTDRIEQVALDALTHVGHGSASDFSRIAGQVESSELFADTWLRQQELLGHVDVRRDETFRLVEWEMTPPTLIRTGPERWVLVGARTYGLLRGLETLVRGLGGSVRGGMDEESHRLEVRADAARLQEAATTLEELGIGVQGDGVALEMARVLPTLSTVEKGLSRASVPAFRSLEIWNHESATWRPATSVAAVAAYRLRTFAPTYVVRSREDLEKGTVGLATAHLAKHIANGWAGDPLIGYHDKSGSVVVPLGADLPGVYGRVLALCSGHIPVVIEKSRMLQYRSVPREVADILHDRLTS